MLLSQSRFKFCFTVYAAVSILVVMDVALAAVIEAMVKAAGEKSQSLL